MAEKVVLAEFEFDTTAIQNARNENADLKRSILELRAEQKKAKAEYDSGNDSIEQYSKKLSKIDEGLKKNNKAYRDNSKVIAANEEANSELNEALNQTAKSEAQAIKNISKLTAARKGLDVSTTAGKKRRDELNAAIDRNNQFLTENSDKYTQQKRNVGNYTESIKDALKGQNLFNGSLGGFGGAVRAFSPVFEKLGEDIKGSIADIRGAAKGTEGLSKAQKATTVTSRAAAGGFRLVGKALLAIPVFLVIAAIGSLVAMFTSTQKGADKLQQGLAGLTAAFDVVIDRVAKIGGAIFGLITGQKSLSEAWDEGKDAVSGLGDELQREIDLAIKLEAANQDLEKSEKLLSFRRAAANAEIKNLNKIAEDTSKSTDERIKAAEDLLAIEADIAKQELENANQALALSLGKEEVDAETLETLDKLKDGTIEYDELLKNIGISESTNEDVDQLLETFKKQQEAIARSAEVETTAQNKLNTIRTQADNERKKASDDYIKRKEAEVAADILASKEALALYETQNRLLSQTSQEKLELERQLSVKRLEILEQEFEAGKVSKTAYETEKINIETEANEKRLNLINESVNQELEAYIQANQTRLDENQLLTQELVNEETTRLDLIAEKQREAEDKRLADGIISQEEYNAAINQINDDNDAAKAEKAAELKAQKEEEQAIDFQLEIERLSLEGEERASIQIKQLEEEVRRKIASGKFTANQLVEIESLAEKKKAKINEAAQEAKLSSTAAAFGDIAGFFGEETAIAKAAALAQASINIQQGITKALAQKGFAGTVEGILIAAAGASSVAKIIGVQEAFADGGVVGLSDGRINTKSNIPTQSNGDDVLATVKRGEVILNQGQQAALGGASTFRAIGVPGFAGGGLVPTSVQNEITSSSISREEAITLAREVVLNTRVVNVARDTVDIAADEIQVEQAAVI